MRKGGYRLLLHLLVGLLITGGLKGQLYNMVTYSQKDGLPEERLNCLMQDSDGYIWMGARFGLYKFNGKKFSSIQLPLTVRNRYVNYLLEDSRKRIWICLNGSGLVILEKNSTRHVLIGPDNSSVSFPRMNAAIVNSVNRIYEIHPELFLVLTDQGAFLYDTQRFVSFGDYLEEGSPAGYPAFYRAQVVHDSLWLKSADRLYLLRVKGWPQSSLLKKYETLGGPITYLQNGQVLMSTPEGIGCLNPRDQYQSINTYYSFVGKNSVNNLFTEGAFTWVSTNDGILLFESDKAKLHLTPANGLPSSLIKDVMKDNEQNYWVATDRGLVLFNDTINKTFLHANDRSVFVNGITLDSTGSVWCIRDNTQIWKIKNGALQEVNIQPKSFFNNPKPSFGYTYIFSDHLRQVWVVYNNELMQVDYDGRVEKHFRLAPGLNTIFEDKKGNLWIISHGIEVLHNNRLYPVAIRRSGGEGIQPASMILDNSGQIWLADLAEGINLGQFQWKEDVVEINITKRFSSKDGLVNMRYAQLAYDSIHDEVWAGSYWNGISRITYRQGNLETLHFNYTNGFPGERLITIFFEKNGDLYCRSSAGLYHFIRNGDHNYTFDAYTVADGLPANEIHALCRDSKGNFWVGTHEGITFFHPGPEISHLPPPNAFIEKISVNGETKNYSNNLISLGAQENAVSFEYYATSYRNNSRLLYSYLLEGFDKDWSPYSSQNTVNYKNLPSGNYRFMVKAKNFLGIESVKKSTVLFSIATPFYRTGWFYLLLATGLLLLIVILYRYRISQVRHEEKIKSQFVQQLSQLEVKALRSQMNPHFIFNSLNAINRYILKNEKTEASAYLTKFAKLIRLILDHSRLPRVPLSQELAALELYLQLESLRFQNNFEYAVSVENELSPQSIFIPPMIIQPIVENAIWHGLLPKGSNCSLKIDFRSNGSNLICTIEDNGIGRSKAEEIQQQQMLRKSSVGMSTTIQRLKLLTEEKQEDASITVEDLYDKFGNAAGTKVKILIPFTYK